MYDYLQVDTVLPCIEGVRPDGSEYADVYFQEGVTFNIQPEPGVESVTYTITADTYISTVSNVQKLVFGEQKGR